MCPKARKTLRGGVTPSDTPAAESSPEPTAYNSEYSSTPGTTESQSSGTIEQPDIEGNTILQLVFVLSVEGAEKQIAVQIDPALVGKPMELFGEARTEVDRLVALGYTLTWYKDAGHSVKLEKLSDLTVTGEMNQRIFGVAAPFVPVATDAPEATAEPPQNAGSSGSFIWTLARSSRSLIAALLLLLLVTISILSSMSMTLQLILTDLYMELMEEDCWAAVRFPISCLRARTMRPIRWLKS